MIIEQDITYFIFILARMSGCIMFSQIFGRGNVPMMFQIGLSIMLSIAVQGVIPVDNYLEVNLLIEYIVLILKELLVGVIIGHIMKLFFSVVVTAGEFNDMQLGLSMAKIYDPKSNISMGISSSILNIMFMLLFFSANGHMSLIKIFISSCKVLPIGSINLSTDLFMSLTELFTNILIFSVKLSLPILAVEFVAEMGLGILMKAVPQIHLFVVNIPLKIFIGFATMLILVPSLASFLDRLITLMFEAIQNNLSLLV